MVGKTKFFCTACKWKFTANYAPNLCPYCGKQNSIQEDVSVAADQLLKEIEEMEGQFAEK
ncbi:MAG: hypothetical protein QXU88_01650 [Candidatus Woesearchaeota archaeon]